MRMCAAFSRQGLAVELFGLQGGSSEKPHDFYNLPADFLVHRRQYTDLALNRVLLFLRRNAPFMRVGAAPNFLLGRAIAKGLKLRPDDILYGRNLAWLVSVTARRPSTPFAFETHQPPQNKMEYAFLKILASRSSFRFCVVISERLKELLLDDCPFLTPETVKVWHDGADETPMDAAPRLSAPGFKVGYVGHLYKGRGLQEIIVPVARALPDISFHIVGGSEDDLQALRALNPPPNVILHGFQRQSELPKFMASFDVVLAPYQPVTTVRNDGNTAEFMSPLKIFEYMASGIALVASDLPVLHEVLTHERNGLFASAENPESWVSAILKLQSDASLKQRVERNALEDIRRKYSWSKRAEGILAAFSV